MGEILSEQEMSALLSESRAAAAAVAAAGPASGRRFAPFSFAEPVPFSADALEKIGALGARFAETMQSRLSRELRREVAISPASVEVVGGADAARLFSGGAHLRFLSTPARHEADLVFDTEVALAVIEARLGGSIAEPQPRRPLTAVEQSLLARLVGACGGAAFASTFGAVLSRDAERTGAAPGKHAGAERGADAGADAVGRYECAPGGNEAPSGSGFASIPFQLSIESRGGGLTLLLPASRAAECVAAAAEAAHGGPSTGVTIPIATLERLPVRVVPRIQGGSISLRDLMALRAGLVVRLDQRDTDPIEILCNGEPVLRGRLIRSGPATALEIASWALPEHAGEEAP